MGLPKIETFLTTYVRHTKIFSVGKYKKKIKIWPNLGLPKSGVSPSNEVVKIFELFKTIKGRCIELSESVDIKK